MIADDVTVEGWGAAQIVCGAVAEQVEGVPHADAGAGATGRVVTTVPVRAVDSMREPVRRMGKSLSPTLPTFARTIQLLLM